ncbi:MAG: ribosome assembly factor SBDS [Candidatus Altiarchaeota archaeon]|nr:ribosome assembly factor SBDS [Candidatus Altiarchaeota archaeon]
MISLEKAITVRLKTFGETFELLVDPDNALAFREGGDVKLDDVLAAEHVFKDAKEGDKASEEVMHKIFKTTDINAIITEILQKGELHLTTEQKKKMLDERRKQIVDTIARNAINPQTQTPHPLARIEAAMDEARVEIVISKSANEQIEKVLKALKPLIPIKFEKLQVAAKIPAQYAGKTHHILKDMGEILREEWQGTEQLLLIEIPAGMQDDLYGRLNALTHGEVKTKVVKHE